jgi:hypothetical protein
MFPKIRESEVDLQAPGANMRQPQSRTARGRGLS